MKYVTILTVLFFLTTGCAKQDAKRSPEEERIAKIYTDLLFRAQEQTASDSSRMEAVLKAHGITKPEFERRLHELANDPAAWHRIVSYALQQLQQADSSYQQPDSTSLFRKK